MMLYAVGCCALHGWQLLQLKVGGKFDPAWFLAVGG
jgi:hypothetical protein